MRWQKQSDAFFSLLIFFYHSMGDKVVTLWSIVVVAFCSLVRMLGEWLTIQSSPALFFFKVEISSCTLIPLFRSGSSHNGSASWDNSGRVFPDELCVSSFPFRFPHYAWPAALLTHSDFVGSRVYACLGITCHLHFWQNDQGLLCATVVTRGWNEHWIRVSMQS